MCYCRQIGPFIFVIFFLLISFQLLLYCFYSFLSVLKTIHLSKAIISWWWKKDSDILCKCRRRPGLAVSAGSWMRTRPGSGPTLALPLIMWPLRLCHHCVRKCVNITFFPPGLISFWKVKIYFSLNWTVLLLVAAKIVSFIRRWLHIACLWSFSFKVLEKNALIIRILLNLWLPSQKIEFTKSQSKSISLYVLTYSLL